MSLSSTILPVADHAYLVYASTNGIFFLYDPVKASAIVFQSCRDSIRWYWELVNPNDGYGQSGAFKTDISPYIGLARGTTWDTEAFAARWDEMETTLGLTTRTSIHPTDKTGAIILRLSPFWLENDTRRSFATLFLRMIAKNPIATLDQAMDMYELAANIKPAIKWFLEGHVNPTYARLTLRSQGYAGVCSELYNLRTPDQLVTKLVKP